MFLCQLSKAVQSLVVEVITFKCPCFRITELSKEVIQALELSPMLDIRFCFALTRTRHRFWRLL